MGRKLIVMLMTLVGCTCASSTALAAPNADYASGQAIVTSPDAHILKRDDVCLGSSPLPASRPVTFTAWRRARRGRR
jgi:hypothetical protein